MTARRRSALAAAFSAVVLASCASTGSSGIDVTRFHLDQPAARGTVFVQPATVAGGGSLEYRTYAEAVAAELRAIGFSPVQSLSQAELVGTLDYTRTTREGIVGGRSPITIGIGGSTFGRHTGVGLGTSFGLGKKRSSSTAIDTLALQIKRRSDSSVVWEGRAVQEARVGSTAADDNTVPRLARALLAGYPGPSGRTVHVKG